MKRKGTRWTVNWAGNGTPEAGQLVLSLSPTGRETYARVRAVRVVKHKTLEEGYSARYAIVVERLAEFPLDELIAWTLHSHPRKKKLPTIDKDPFSPLL